MKRCQGRSAPITCPRCDFGSFKRNHYFTGKLLVERDFTDEQRYFIDKLRHHHQRLHGKGVVCGLRITQHEQEACRDRYICIEPGTAIDCCGREIVVLEGECIDITRFEKVKALFDAAEASGDGEPEEHILQICIRYRECPTEEIPVLYDECGGDETRCAPNRILESWELDVLVVDEAEAEEPEEDDADCCDRLQDALYGCPSCDTGDCIVLATIEGYRPGFRFTDMPAEARDGDSDRGKKIARIDNLKHRLFLPSTQLLTEVVKCLCEREPGGNGGEPVHGIDRVEVEFLDCREDGTASYSPEEREWVLKLEIPKGCDGEDGEDGSPGANGVNGLDGVCLEENLTQITALSWTHGQNNARFADIELYGMKHAAVVIAFSKKVHVDGAVGNVFQVLLRHVVENDGMSLICRCAVPGTVMPVKVTNRADSVITEVEPASGPAMALAFIPDNKYEDIFNNASEHWVVLRGNFVIDTNERAIDAEFVCGRLPSGERRRPDGTNHGVQGGVFESWFSVRGGPD